MLSVTLPTFRRETLLVIVHNIGFQVKTSLGEVLRNYPLTTLSFFFIFILFFFGITVQDSCLHTFDMHVFSMKFLLC